MARKLRTRQIDVIDVEQRFPKYKLGFEDPSFAKKKDPWNKVIECRFGHVSPSGGSALWACVRRGKLSRTILEGGVSWGEIKQDGDDGIAIEFDVADSVAAFKVLKPRRRKVCVVERVSVS